MESPKFVSDKTPIQSSSQKPKVRVIDSVWTLVVSFFVVGPLILPLLWRNPRFTFRSKMTWSIAIVLATVALILFAARINAWLLDSLLGGSLP